MGNVRIPPRGGSRRRGLPDEAHEAATDPFLNIDGARPRGSSRRVSPPEGELIVRGRRAIPIVAVLLLVAWAVPAGASATAHPGSPKWCRHHPKSTRTTCQKSGGVSPSTVSVTVAPNPMVETGDSDVYGVFSVATDPVYAKQTVEIVAGLANRCGLGATWFSNDGSFTGSTAVAALDDDGNASFTLLGASCAPGPLQVTVLVEAGDGPSTTLTFTIDPPAPEI